MDKINKLLLALFLSTFSLAAAPVQAQNCDGIAACFSYVQEDGTLLFQRDHCWPADRADFLARVVAFYANNPVLNYEYGTCAENNGTAAVAPNQITSLEGLTSDMAKAGIPTTEISAIKSAMNTSTPACDGIAACFSFVQADGTLLFQRDHCWPADRADFLARVVAFYANNPTLNYEYGTCAENNGSAASAVHQLTNIDGLAKEMAVAGVPATEISAVKSAMSSSEPACDGIAACFSFVQADGSILFQRDHCWPADRADFLARVVAFYANNPTLNYEYGTCAENIGSLATAPQQMTSLEGLTNDMAKAGVQTAEISALKSAMNASTPACDGIAACFSFVQADGSILFQRDHCWPADRADFLARVVAFYANNPTLNYEYGTCAENNGTAAVVPNEIASAEGLLHAMKVNGVSEVEIKKAKAAFLGLADNQLQVYPNPVQDVVTVEYLASDDQNITVRLFDALGKEMELPLYTALAKGSTWKQTIDMSAHSPGIYIVQITTETGVQSTQRLTLK